MYVDVLKRGAFLLDTFYLFFDNIGVKKSNRCVHFGNCLAKQVVFGRSIIGLHFLCGSLFLH